MLVPSSDASGRLAVETIETRGKPRRAGGLSANSPAAALGAALLVATIQLSLGCADEVESEIEQTVAANPELAVARPNPAARRPRNSPPPDGQSYRLQRKREWWNHTREVLFTDIELSPEQALAVDEIIEDQLSLRAQLQQLDADLTDARRTQNSSRIQAARTAFRERKEQLKKPHEIYEEMRAVLAEAQRPAFDMNRARHVAAMQGSARSPSESTAEEPYQD